MSGIWIIIWVFALIRLANYILSKEPAPVKAEKKNSIPQPNAQLDRHPLIKSCYILNIDPYSSFSLDDVNRAYYRRLQEMSEQREKGVVPKYELKECQSAKIIITDNYKYAAFRN
ncbi:hypothetical protein [Sediminibacterium salmoneum]|uniref:hypothetical protein n=1 Tax=Sediminibacterium salmoneum TaxID=426421 RepID=UPI00047EE86F|nr:hypothetical protein [Sediminibacterium salmoneum]